MVIEVLKEHLSRQVFTPLDDACDSFIGQSDLDLASALSREQDADGCTTHIDVPVAQRGQPERSIFARVLLVADARERQLEQLDDRGDDLFSRQAVDSHVACDAASDTRQLPGEPDHAVELVRIADHAPARVVKRLLATSLVPPRRLQVTAGVSRDPDVVPSRGDDKRLDSIQRRGVADLLAGGVAIDEGFALTNTPDARFDVRRICEARVFGAFNPVMLVLAAPCGAIPAP